MRVLGGTAPRIDLLQRHDVRLRPLDDADHACEIEPAVRSDAAANVPGHHADGSRFAAQGSALRDFDTRTCTPNETPSQRITAAISRTMFVQVGWRHISKIRYPSADMITHP